MLTKFNRRALISGLGTRHSRSVPVSFLAMPPSEGRLMTCSSRESAWMALLFLSHVLCSYFPLSKACDCQAMPQGRPTLKAQQVGAIFIPVYLLKQPENSSQCRHAVQ